MASIKGNQFWKLRSKHGRDKLFDNASLLWDAACEYFEWCDKNPWEATKTKSKLMGSETETSPTQRPYTLTGLCLYLGCNQAYFRQFKEKADEDFMSVITQIEETIETQQFEGAVVGAFNANIIARKLGLADKQEYSGDIKANISLVQMETSVNTFASSENEHEQ